jgi:hypothetical protein
VGNTGTRRGDMARIPDQILGFDARCHDTTAKDA